jgi:hypothetical protein
VARRHVSIETERLDGAEQLYGAGIRDVQGHLLLMRGAAAFLLLAAAFAAHAQAPARDAKPSRWTLYEENDTHLISRVNGSDRHYTQGLKLEFLFPEGDMTAPARKLASLLPRRYGVCGESAQNLRCSSGFTIGQNIYTPQDISHQSLQADERPYAAWLYGGLSIQLRSPLLIQTVEIDVGAMGPRALGRTIQTKWHDLINVAYPQGWQNQIGNEPGVLLQYFQRRQHAKVGGEDGSPWSADFSGRYGGIAGNVFTYVLAEPVFRLGYNVSNDFAETIPEVIEKPGVAAMPMTGPRSTSLPPVEFYVFAGSEGRTVLVSEVLEGNCCSHPASHGVRHKPFVGAIEYGFAARLRSMRLTWRQIHRTREFVGQKRPDIYGSVALTYDRDF